MSIAHAAHAVPSPVRTLRFVFDVIMEVKPGTTSSYPAGKWLEATYSDMEDAHTHAVRCRQSGMARGADFYVCSAEEGNPHRRAAALSPDERAHLDAACSEARQDAERDPGTDNCGLTTPEINAWVAQVEADTLCEIYAARELAKSFGITVEYDSDRDEEYADRLAWQSDWDTNTTADWPGWGWDVPEDAGPATEPTPADSVLASQIFGGGYVEGQGAPSDVEYHSMSNEDWWDGIEGEAISPEEAELRMGRGYVYFPRP